MTGVRVQALSEYALWLASHRTDVLEPYDFAMCAVASLAIMAAGGSLPRGSQLASCWEFYLTETAEVWA